MTIRSGSIRPWRFWISPAPVIIGLFGSLYSVIVSIIQIAPITHPELKWELLAAGLGISLGSWFALGREKRQAAQIADQATALQFSRDRAASDQATATLERYERLLTASERTIDILRAEIPSLKASLSKIDSKLSASIATNVTPEIQQVIDRARVSAAAIQSALVLAGTARVEIHGHEPVVTIAETKTPLS